MLNASDEAVNTDARDFWRHIQYKFFSAVCCTPAFRLLIFSTLTGVLLILILGIVVSILSVRILAKNSGDPVFNPNLILHEK
jgi:hypothetical protein